MLPRLAIGWRFRRGAAASSLAALLALGLLAGCDQRFEFEATESGRVVGPSARSADPAVDIEDEIRLFSNKLETGRPNGLNNGPVAAGLSALANGHYVEANLHLQRALKYEPRNPYLHMLNGLCHQLRGDAGDPEQYGLAEVGYGLAARLDPGDSEVPYLMGVLQYSQQRYRRAQDHFATAVSLDRNRPDYLLALAASSYYLGELDRAYTAVRRALALAPRSAAALQSGGVIYASLGAFDEAEVARTQLASLDRRRQRLLERRIDDWRDYHGRATPRPEPAGHLLRLAQDLDVFGVPEGGSFDDQGLDDQDFDDQDFSDQDFDGLGASDDLDGSETFDQAPDAVAGDSDDDPTGTDERPAAVAPTQLKPAVPRMALIDVAIIRSEEIFRSSKGVNLLNGLNIFFSGGRVLERFGSSGADGDGASDGESDLIRLQLGTAGAGLTYSLNIFSDDFDRNEVIARPTILVEDQKKSSFFSGGTMHIVLEGGVAGGGAVEPITSGIRLEVRPEFIDAETLDLNVFAQRTFLESGLSQVSDTITGTTFATTSRTSISANLTLRYGETMVLSGLSDQERELVDDKVPGLGDVPGVQYLFRNQTRTTSKKTVLVLLTPRHASLSYEDGTPIEDRATSTGESRTDDLEKAAPWMRPAPHLKAIMETLNRREFFNRYRTGDMQLEDWASPAAVADAILRTVEYLYISYDLDAD